MVGPQKKKCVARTQMQKCDDVPWHSNDAVGVLENLMVKPPRLLRLPAVLDRVGIGRTTLYSWIADARFPAQFRIGVRSVAWDERAVDAWIEERLSENNRAADSRKGDEE